MSAKDLLANPELFNKEVQRVFENVDSDKSGFINKSELGNALKTIAEVNFFDAPTDADIQAELSKFDTNKDGQLSQTEFAAFVKILLEREDI
jgi:Ca2+-binding EF-hand superfamily protein